MKGYSSNSSIIPFPLTKEDKALSIATPSFPSGTATEQKKKGSDLSISPIRTTSPQGKQRTENEVDGKERRQVKKKESAVCLMPSVSPFTDEVDCSSTTEPHEVHCYNESHCPPSRWDTKSDDEDCAWRGQHPQTAEGPLSNVALPPLHHCSPGEWEEAKTKDQKSKAGNCHLAPQGIPMYIGEYVHGASGSHKRPRRHGMGCYQWRCVPEFTTMVDEKERRDVSSTVTSLSTATAAWDAFLTLSPLPLPDGGTLESHSSSLLQAKENRVGTLFVPQPTSKIARLVYYKGDWVRDELHGQGVAVFTEGTCYVGSFSHGKKDGNGVLFYPTPEETTATSFFSLPPTLPSSAPPFPYLHAYQGEFEDDLKHGNGKEYFSSGAVYEGHYWRGYRSGKGSILFSDGVTRYDGQWRFNHFHGYGRVEYKNGDLYEGYFKEGKRHGEGKAVFAKTGSTYEGGWYQDEPHAKVCNLLLFRLNEEKKKILTAYNGYAWNGKMVCQRQHVPHVFSFDKRKERHSSATEEQEDEKVSENSFDDEKMHSGDPSATHSSVETKTEPHMDEKALYF